MKIELLHGLINYLWPLSYVHGLMKKKMIKSKDEVEGNARYLYSKEVERERRLPFVFYT